MRFIGKLQLTDREGAELRAKLGEASRGTKVVGRSVEQQASTKFRGAQGRQWAEAVG